VCATFAGSQVRRDRLVFSRLGLAFSYYEVNIIFIGQFPGGNVLDTGGVRRLFFQQAKKLAEVSFKPFYFNGHVSRGISYPAIEVTVPGQTINKGPETDTLHYALDLNVQSGPGVNFQRGTSHNLPVVTPGNYTGVAAH